MKRVEVHDVSGFGSGLRMHAHELRSSHPNIPPSARMKTAFSKTALEVLSLNFRRSERDLVRKNNSAGRLRIRNVSLWDLNRILDIRKVSLVKEFELFGADESGFRKRIITYLALRLVETFTGRFFGRIYVGEVAHRIIGIAILTAGGECYRISSVMVDPEYRRKGYGSKLVSKACDDAMHLGARRVCLDVLVKNTPARRLYESLGFQNFEKRLYFSADCSRAKQENLPSLIRFEKQSSSALSRLWRMISTVWAVENFTILKGTQSIGILESKRNSRKRIAKVSVSFSVEYDVEEINEVFFIEACRRVGEIGRYKVILDVDDRYAKLGEACKRPHFKFLSAAYSMCKSL